MTRFLDAQERESIQAEYELWADRKARFMPPLEEAEKPEDEVPENRPAATGTGSPVYETPIVTLTKYEVYMGAMAAVAKQVKLIDQDVGYYGINNRKRGWQDNIDGLLGELAFAKYRNAYWSPSPNSHLGKKADVDGMEVRTANEPDQGLIFRPRDDERDERIFVCVLSHDCPRFTIFGWIIGEDARREEWLRYGDVNRPKAYFVPQDALNPMETLPC